MRALGADIRYVKGNYGENEVAVVERQRMAAEIASEIPGAVFMNQSDNAANAGGYADWCVKLSARLAKSTRGLDVLVLAVR